MPLFRFSPPAPARAARRALAGAAAAVGLTLAAVVPAVAATDVTGSTSGASTALVTRLTVDSGRAWVTVQVTVGATGVAGFEVRVPTDHDAWTGPADIPVREMGIHCRWVGGPDLHYACGDVSATRGDAPYLPLGGYEVTLPVSHTGTLPPGVTGHSWVDVVDSAGQARRTGFDPFPVVDGAHFLSTAELRTAPLQADPGTLLSGLATLPVSLTVVPGEQVASLDVTLPRSASWSLVGTNALAQGVWCSERDTTAGEPILHCAGRYGAPLPTGRYQLVSTLRFAGPRVDGRNTRVALTMVGGTAEQVDSCHFRFPTTA